MVSVGYKSCGVASGRHTGRTALITGGSSGIGAAYAQRLADEGANVIVVDLRSGEALRSGIEATGVRFDAYSADVALEEDVRRVADAVIQSFGRVDVLVNNVGICPWSTFDDLDFDTWRRTMAVNVDAMFHTCKAFVPTMRERRWGRIINIASGVPWLPIPAMSHYTASKMAVVGFIRGLATDLGPHGITVNGIAPSLVRTPTTERDNPPDMFGAVAAGQAIHREQMPLDLVGALSFLASDDAEFITGQTLAVNGGNVRL